MSPSIDIGGSKFESDRWVFFLEQKLTPDQMKSVSAVMNSAQAATMGIWDKDGKEYSMAVTLWCVKQVVPEAEIKNWHAEPMMILVKSIGIGSKIYEIENAMSFKDAADTAKKTWKEQFKGGGFPAGIASVKLATEKEMKKMVEVKPR